MSLGIGIGMSPSLLPSLLGSAINAPTYALHTAAGVSPASWDVTGDSTFQPGMWVHQQFAADAGFTTSLVDYYTQIQGSDWEATSANIGGSASVGIAGASQTFTQPTGTYYTRCRFETLPGDPANNTTSAWSNTVTDTISTSVAVLNTANGVNKNALITVSGSPALSFSNATAGNGKNSVRSTIEQASNKAQFEVTITSGPTGDIFFGIDDGTADLSTAIIPGLGTSTGIAVELNIGTYVVLYWNSSANSVVLVNNVAGTVALNDVFTVVWDKVNHTVEVWRTRSGTSIQMGTTQSGLPALTHSYSFGGIQNTASGGTMNYGATTYAKTPGTGVAAYWA